MKEQSCALTFELSPLSIPILLTGDKINPIIYIFPLILPVLIYRTLSGIKGLEEIIAVREIVELLFENETL